MKRLKLKQLLLFMLLNCLLLSALVALLFKKPMFKGINQVEFVSVVDSFFNFRINLSIENPNLFSMSGENLVLKLEESGQVFGEGTIEPFYLGRKSESNLFITLKLNFREVLKKYNEQSKDTLIPSVLVTGSFLPAFFIGKINLEKRISKRELFKVMSAAFSGGNLLKADSFSIREISAFESQIDFNILFTNSFNFDFSIKEITGGVFHAQDRRLALGDVSLRKSMNLPSKERVSIPFQLIVKNFALAKVVLKSKLKDLRSYFFVGNAVVDVNGELINIPFDIPMGNTTDQTE